MNNDLKPGEKVGLGILAAALWLFAIYAHFVSPSDKLNEFLWGFLIRLDLLFFILPFSAYLAFKGQKIALADKAVVEVIKGMFLILCGIALALLALYIRFCLLG